MSPRKPPADLSPAAITSTLADLKVKAARDMFAEGCTEGSYTLEARLVADFGEGQVESATLENGPNAPENFKAANAVELELKAIKALREAGTGEGHFTPTRKAEAHIWRNVLIRDHGRIDVPVYRLADMSEGSFASGPAILEEDFFTCRVPEGWQFTLSAAGDVLLTRED